MNYTESSPGIGADASAHEDSNPFSCSDNNSSGNEKPSSISDIMGAPEKPFKCRFCPATFSKSQALGGHMNRHRSEREYEQILSAQELLSRKGLSTVRSPWQNPPPFFTPNFHTRNLICSKLNQGMGASTPPANDQILQTSVPFFNFNFISPPNARAEAAATFKPAGDGGTLPATYARAYTATAAADAAGIFPSNYARAEATSEPAGEGIVTATYSQADTDTATDQPADGEIVTATYAQADGSPETLYQSSASYMPSPDTTDGYEFPNYQQPQLQAYYSSSFNHYPASEFDEIPIQTSQSFSKNHEPLHQPHEE